MKTALGLAPTVKTLIEILETYPQNSPILIATNAGGSYVDFVELINDVQIKFSDETLGGKTNPVLLTPRLIKK